MRPRRVALLSIHSSPLTQIGSGQAGGMNLYVRRLADGLATSGIHVDMFTRRTDRELPKIVTRETGARLIHLAAGPARSLPKSVLPLHIPAVVEAIRSFAATEGIEYDVLHSHYWQSGLVATRVRSDTRTPVVHMFHTLSKVKEFYFGGPDQNDSALRSDGERCLINNADAIVGATEAELEHIEKLYRRTPARYSVIPPGVDLQRFRPLDKAICRRKLGIDGEPVILFVGRLDRIKGLDLLLRTVGELEPEQRSALRLVVLGHDPVAEHKQLAVYRHLASRLGIESNVDFRGVVSQNVLALYYAAADILAVPSAYESFGMAAIEAMACRTPVLAFRTGGLGETIEDGKTGFLARPGDRADFTAKLRLAMSSTALERMGQRARLTAERYSWDTVTQQTIALYDELLAERYFVFGHAVGAS